MRDAGAARSGPGREEADGAQAWLARWAGLLRLPRAQARSAAVLAAAAAVGIALMGLPDWLQAPRRPAGTDGLPAGATGEGSLWMAATPLGAPAPERPGYGEEVERELEAVLGLMEGVGGVKVLITWEQGPQQVVAFNETLEQRSVPVAGGEASRSQAGSERRLQRQVAILRDGDGRRETPVVLAERQPVVKGVMVVADGARDPGVRLALQRAVASALGIAPYRISVEPKRR